ncbi:hypothetical protein OIU84_000905 [Salix udensis]|uniref:G domain-containing protein n=1 Tax=Salix udensis TaxID=889485 RepID=A0AAD6L5Q1_9ROSI|nr:hypothetical protein OIU84_000905 [Salix udensis]
MFAIRLQLLCRFFFQQEFICLSLFAAHMARSESSSPSSDTSCSSRCNQETGSPQSLHQVAEDSCQSIHGVELKKADPLTKIEDLRINFFRLLLRFGHSHDNLLVGKVLHRLHLAAAIRAGETNLIRVKGDRARAVAAEQEASGIPELNSSLRILVVGKTGVGKSATINSVFDQTKALTDAFRPATIHIKEVVGSINGVKEISLENHHRTLFYSLNAWTSSTWVTVTCPLLKLMTEVFGNAFWFNTILVMTHGSASPEGPSGFPINY